MASIAPGSNPYYDALQASFRASPLPTPGYKARLVVLGCCIASLPISAAVLMYLHWLAMKRKGDKVFLFRTINREGGTYIVGSRTPLFCLLALSISITLGLSIMYADKFLANFANGVVGYNICLFVFWLLTFIVGWALTCSNLQAYLLARRRKWVTGRVANSFFIGFGTLFTLFLIGITIWGGVKLKKLYEGLLSNFGDVAKIVASYNGTLDQTEYAAVQREINAVAEEANNYIEYSSNFYIAFSIVPVPIALVNLASVLLVLLIRRQRRENRDMESGSMSGLTDSKRPSEVGKSSDLGEQRATKSARTITDKRLQTAEQSLLVDAVAITIICLAQCVANLWSAVMVRRMLTSSWPRLEATLLLPAWVAGVPAAIAILVQIGLALRSRSHENEAAASASERPDFVTRPSASMIGGRTTAPRASCFVEKERDAGDTSTSASPPASPTHRPPFVRQQTD